MPPIMPPMTPPAMLLHMLGCCMGWDIGDVGDGVTCDGPGDVGVGDVVVLGAE
jgi:hypothetical protein